MYLQTQPGNLPSQRQVAPGQNAPGGSLAEVLISELMPQYYTLLKNSKMFSLAALAQNPTAFVGGAAGTPLLSLYNPANSGVDLVILQARYGIRTTGSAAGTLDFNFFGANQGGVPVTGTQTQARNMFSQSNTGSQAYGMVNVVNTAALASTLIAPSLSVGANAASPALNVGSFVDDIKGALIVPPGCYLALGSSVTLTAASIDAVLSWAEIPA